MTTLKSFNMHGGSVWPLSTKMIPNFHVLILAYVKLFYDLLSLQSNSWENIIMLLLLHPSPTYQIDNTRSFLCPFSLSPPKNNVKYYFGNLIITVPWRPKLPRVGWVNLASHLVFVTKLPFKRRKSQLF